MCKSIKKAFLTQSVSYKTNHQNTAFTLVELLSVLTILLLLMSCLFPIGEKIVEKGRRAVTASNLRQVALAYTAFIQDNERNSMAFREIRTASDWANLLAKSGILNDASMYCVKTDPLLVNGGYSIPKRVGYQDKSQKWHKDEDFSKLPLSLVFITGLSPYAPLSTTPLAYTRGLNVKKSEWSNGTYGNEGGFIVFLDGHVQFFTTLNNSLIKYGTAEYTSDIREAVNVQAQAFDWQGQVW